MPLAVRCKLTEALTSLSGGTNSVYTELTENVTMEISKWPLCSYDSVWHSLHRYGGSQQHREESSTMRPPVFLLSIASSSRPQLAQTIPRSRSRQPFLPSPRSISRAFSNVPSPAARQALGRITPKRIAVPLPPGSGNGLPKASVWRPIVVSRPRQSRRMTLITHQFCSALGGGGFLLAATYTNYDTAKWVDRLGGGSFWRRGQAQPSDREIARAKQLDEAKVAQETLNKLTSALSFLPKILFVPVVRTYIIYEEWKLNTPAAQYAPMELILGMGGVFLLWKVRRLEPWMRKWWLHRPMVFGGRSEWQNSVTLFTSVVGLPFFPSFESQLADDVLSYLTSRLLISPSIPSPSTLSVTQPTRSSLPQSLELPVFPPQPIHLTSSASSS